MFFDDGLHGDGNANDGIYGGSIIAGVAGSGAYELRITASGQLSSGEEFTRAPTRTFFVTGTGRAGSFIGGYVYVDVNDNGIQDTSERVLPNVTIRLSGQTSAVTTTNIEGYYEFRNMPDGLYSITEVQPILFVDGKDSTGSPKLGVQSNDAFSDIALTAGVRAVNYNFGERGLRPEYISKLLLLNTAPILDASGINHAIKVGVNTIAFRPTATNNFVAIAKNLRSLQIFDSNMLPVAVKAEGEMAFASLREGERYLLVADAAADSNIVLKTSFLNLSSHNFALAADVNADGIVSPLDALLVINYLNSAARSISDGALREFYYDVSNDGLVSPLDSLLVINSLNQKSSARIASQRSINSEAEGESEGLADTTDQVFSSFDSFESDFQSKRRSRTAKRFTGS